MSATPEHVLPAATAAATEPCEDSVIPSAGGAAGLLRAWAHLLNLELVLAQRSLHRLLLGTIAVPVIGMSTWLSVSALLVVAIHAYTDSWLLALLLGAGAQSLALALLLQQLRRWTRDLGLPQSRAALARALARMS
jgi:hypothetical protein